jgi:hypothetical protein
MTMRAARRRARRTVLPLIAAIALLSPQAIAASIETDLAGHRLVLPVPAGFCTIDRSVEVQRELGEQIERVMSQRDVYLGIAIDCDELAALEDAPERGFSTYIVWVAESDGSGGPVLYPDIARSDFVEQAADQIVPADSGAASQDATDLWQQELDNDAIEVEALEFGAAWHDDIAYYTTGRAQVGGADGERSQATGAFGTLVHFVHVQALLYRPFDRSGSVERLQETATALAGTLVAANPDSDPAGGAAALGKSGLSLLRSAIVGGLLGALVAGLVWLVRRMRRTPSRHFD